MIIRHPSHPSHLCQDPDSISRTFLEQVVLVSIVIIVMTKVKPKKGPEIWKGIVDGVLRRRAVPANLLMIMRAMKMMIIGWRRSGGRAAPANLGNLGNLGTGVSDFSCQSWPTTPKFPAQTCLKTTTTLSSSTVNNRKDCFYGHVRSWGVIIITRNIVTLVGIFWRRGCLWSLWGATSCYTRIYLFG